MTIALPGGVELKLVKVEPGSFTNTDINKTITLTRKYWIGETEVTQGQYAAIMEGVVNEKGETCKPRPSYCTGDDRLPVERVSWYDAMAFCRKLNSLHEGKLPQGYRFDLPTEAHWEYAARGGAEGIKRDKAYRYSGGDDVAQVAWCKTTSGNKPHKVGELRPNELGIYDTNGNLWEWCSDVFKMNFSTKPVVDLEEGGVFGGERVIRGGCYFTPPEDFNVFTRHGDDPSVRDAKIGFRVALVWDKKTDGAWAGNVMKGTKKTVRLFNKDELGVDVLNANQIVLLGYPSEHMRILREGLKQEFGADKVSFQEDNGMMSYAQQIKAIVEKTPSVVLMNVSRRYAKDDTQRSLFEKIIQYDMKFLSDSSIPFFFIVSDKALPEDDEYEVKHGGYKAKLQELNQAIVDSCRQRKIVVLDESSPFSEVAGKIRELSLQ